MVRKDGTWYLVQDGEVIAIGDHIWSFSNGDYSYKIYDTWYLIRGGRMIARGDQVWSFIDGDYSYRVDGKNFHFNKAGNNITKTGRKDFQWSYDFDRITTLEDISVQEWLECFTNLIKIIKKEKIEGGGVFIHFGINSCSVCHLKSVKTVKMHLVSPNLDMLKEDEAYRFSFR